MSFSQSIFKPAYEMFKSVAREDLNRRREGDLDPRLVSSHGAYL